MSAVPVQLVTRLAHVLEQHHADALLAAILTTLGPHISSIERPTGPDTSLPLGVVVQLHRLLGRIDLLPLLPAVLKAAAPHLGAPDPDPIPEGAVTEGLTKREFEILSAIARGRTNAVIGRDLGMSEDTVKTHVSKVLSKLAAHDRTHAVTRGYQLGYLLAPPARNTPAA